MRCLKGTRSASRDIGAVDMKFHLTWNIGWHNVRFGYWGYRVVPGTTANRGTRKMNRPTGVTVLAVLQFIGAGFCVVAALLMMVGGTFVAAILGRVGAGGDGGTAMAGMGALFGVVGGVFCLALAALYGVVGWGMWSLKSWARIVTIVLAAIGALFQVMGIMGSMLHFRIGALIWNLIWLGVNGFIVWYLIQPRVKAAFDGPQPQLRAAGM
jgi:hypothetical protein